MMDLRMWADRVNEQVGHAFTQYLLGNRPFEECACRALEYLLDVNQDGAIQQAYNVIQHTLEGLEQGGSLSTDDAVGVLTQIQGLLDGTDAPALPPSGTGGLLSDHEIIALARAGMIEPFVNPQVSKHGDERVLSYGVSSYGYDARVSDEFKVFTNVNTTVLDPKNFDERSFVDVRATDGYVIIPPNSFVLGRTVEKFKIPRDVLVVCVGKSTLARLGVIVNVTPLEPEWTGHVTLEFSNTTPLPAKLYANEGACQFLFLRASSPCLVSYADRRGKYQGQTGVTLPRMVK